MRHEHARRAYTLLGKSIDKPLETDRLVEELLTYLEKLVEEEKERKHWTSRPQASGEVQHYK